MFDRQSLLPVLCAFETRSFQNTLWLQASESLEASSLYCLKLLNKFRVNVHSDAVGYHRSWVGKRI